MIGLMGVQNNGRTLGFFNPATASLKGEIMKKLIEFKTLNSICAYRYPHYIDTRYECENEENVGSQCSSKVCPIWKKLKEVKK